MPLRGAALILLSAFVLGIGYHKQIYKYIKVFFRNNEE